MATISKEIYTDGSPFVYIGRDSYATVGAVAGVGLPPILFPEPVIIAGTCDVTTADIKVQVSRSSPSQVQAGVAFWEDLNAGSGGTSVDRVETFDPVIAIRMYIIDSPNVGDAAELYVIAAPPANLQGLNMATPDGGLCSIRKNDTGAASVVGTRLVQSGAVAGGVELGGISGTEFAGVMLSDGIPDGGYCLVVVAGDCYALMTNATAVSLGDIIISSAADAGRFQAATPPAPYTAPDIVTRIGYALEGDAGGVDQLVYMHIGN